MSGEIKELHWLMEMVQNVDAGLVVLDRESNIQLWNGFMANHSGLTPPQTLGRNLFGLFPEIPAQWFQRKLAGVFALKTRSFITWEQRPYLLRFKNYRPITGMAEFMYQNVTLIPLASSDGDIRHVGVILYDVTDTAASKLQLETANDQLAQLSRTDRLTGLNNRGHWEECLHTEFARCLRTHETASLVMFDIDHFKKINDTYGHQAGDEVIRTVADVLRTTIRNTDIAGRYGGEEFGVVLPVTKAREGQVLAERIRTKVEAITVSHGDSRIRFTVSLGIAEFDEGMEQHKDWLKQADQALYQAKGGGRNQTVVYAE